MTASGKRGKWNHALAVAFGLTLPAAQAALAKDMPPGWVTLPSDYWSTDMSEVTVDLVDWSLRDHGARWIAGSTLADGTFKEGKPYQTIRLPRAYIYYANPWSRRDPHPEFRVDVLPDQIATNHLIIAMSATGAPFSVAWTNWDRQRPDMGLPIAGNLASPGRMDERLLRRYGRKRLEMRALTDLVEIYTTSRTVPTREALRKIAELWRWKTPPKRYLGYDSYGSRPDIGRIYINEEAADGIVIADCLTSPETAPAHKNFFCTYYFALNDDLRVTMRFIDFRVNGGLAFMRARVRAFKKRFCLVLKCDQRALQAANLTEAELEQ